MQNETAPHAAGRHPRAIAAAMILFGLLAVPIGLSDPQGSPTLSGDENSLLRRQADAADARFGFPVAPEPDAPPRGPGP